MYVKIRFGTLLFLVTIKLVALKAQPIDNLSLSAAYKQVEANYPLSGNKQLLQEVSELSKELIEKSRLPKINSNFEGRIQSENIQIGSQEAGSPLNLSVPRESYNANLTFDYTLYDGGIIAAQRQVEDASLRVNQQQLEVALRQLKTRVNTLFFAIELARQQKALLATSIENINTQIETQEAGVKLGTVLESELSKLLVRKLELMSDESRLEGDISAYFSVLERLLGVALSDDTELIIPDFSKETMDGEISRPEQKLYVYQKGLLAARETIVDAKRRPQIGVFAQGGVGYPNPLNFAEIDHSLYGLGGLRVQWTVFDWNQKQTEKEKLRVQAQQVEVERETFEFDISSREREYLQKMGALAQQLENDEQIVALQQDILTQTAVQLNNGVINSNDYLLQVNAELAARQELALHQVQLRQLQIDYLTHFGKL